MFPLTQPQNGKISGSGSERR